MSVCAVLAVLSSSIFYAAADEYLPWDLRDHYTFSSPGASFSFDVSTGEWKVDIERRGTIVADAHAEIVLGSGEVLPLPRMTKISDDRFDFTDAFGEGMAFRSVFTAEKGLTIIYRINRYKERPFLTLTVQLENTGSAPVEIAAIRPAVFNKGVVRNLEDGVTVEKAYASRRGNFAMVHRDSHASLMTFDVDNPDMILGLGLLQSGAMESHIDVDKVNNSWEGSVNSVFEPHVQLRPGMRIQSDALWLTFSLDKNDTAEQYHAWAEGMMVGSVNKDNIPNGWLTLNENATAENLIEAARTWDIPNVFHVLVPGNWANKPGSLNGSTPAYPRDMKTLARSIRNMSMKPGLTIHPLQMSDAPKKFTVQAQDGSAWLDVTNPNAMEYGVKHWQSILKWNYEFFVVGPTGMPEDLLSTLNLTHASVDMLAFTLLKTAVGTFPVLPSPEVTFGANLQDWKRAGETTEWYEDYGVPAGPVRFMIGDLKEVSKELKEAIKAFNGPVEFVGNPNRKVRRELAVAMVPYRFRALQVSRARYDANAEGANQLEFANYVQVIRQD